MAKAKGKTKGKKAAKGKKKRKATRVAKPKRKVPAKKKPKRAKAPATAKPSAELKRLQQLHGQLLEQIRAKDSTISMQMQEILELKRALEDLRTGPLHWRP
ncbi:MAG: hypothetical protein FVQ06_02715 [candidate division NC10 bacterium]|nr:hypothetical protein [candidate division NC10 bacterium]